MNPTNLKVGNIIEAQMSFLVVLLKGGKYRMMVTLWALTLLDCQEIMVSLSSSQRTIQPHMQTGSTNDNDETSICSFDKRAGDIKQKVGYRDKDKVIVETRGKKCKPCQ
jgi:hypothetical protein